MHAVGVVCVRTCVFSEVPYIRRIPLQPNPVHKKMHCCRCCVCVFNEVPYIRRIPLQPNPGIMFTHAVGVVRARVCVQ